MEQPKIIEFDKCPVCGSKERLAGQLAKKEKKKGTMRKDLNFYAHIITGVIKDPQYERQILYGAAIPAYRIYLDVCLQCGTYYAAKVEIAVAVKALKEPIQSKKPPDIELLKGRG